ncbi:MAG: nitroreductase [Actinomycetota bacterium]|nr:nitroreductase [Actinomycetota bacterium]
MAVAAVSTLDRDAAEAVVALASRAPSLHNTQPWHWQLQDGRLTLRADRSRQLRVADPDGHSLHVSCGAAAELTQLALAARGWIVDTSLLPDPADPDLLASFRLTSHEEPNQEAAQQIGAAGRRRSERRVFGPRPVSSHEIERLREAAQAPAVYAHFPLRADENLELAVAISRADTSERDDPAYAAEMAEWVRRDPGRPDGVPTSVIPAVPDDQPRHTDIPLRDFELGIPGTQLISTGIDERPLIAVIFTDGDNPVERLRAGGSMMRLMIQAELDGLATCALSQAVDLLFFRSQLRTVMSWTGYPQMLLRLGQRPESVPPPLTARRPVGDVLTVANPPQPPTQFPAEIGA